MAQMFEDNRTYDSDDPELDIFGSKQKRAKWRHHKFGPAWIKIGRKVLYAGSDLNSWLASRRIDPNQLNDDTSSASNSSHSTISS
jgi:hypothetical protein